MSWTALLAPAQADDLAWLLPLIYLLAFMGVFIFTLVGFLLFSTGWESYEERYLEEAERSLDDLFLTIPPQQLLWLSLLSGAAGFVLPFALTSDIASSLAFGLLGVAGPRLALRLHKRRRAQRFLDQLVPALNTVTNALRTGFALPKAFHLIAQDMPKPICQEFGILVQELRLGIEPEEGLRSMYERLPSQDLDLVVTSITISNQVGGNLAEVFDRISETIRERNRIEGRIDALTAQGRMQGILVSLLPIFVALMIHMIDPTFMTPMFEHPIGWVVMAVMVVMLGLGYFFVRKITTIEV